MSQETDGRESTAVPFDPVRRAIANRVTVSCAIPTFTATAAADVEDLFALRTQLNQPLSRTGQKLSVNDFVVRAVALALRRHPQVNASYSAERRGETLLHGRVHIGLAIAAPAGLMVPVLRDTDRSSPAQISSQTRGLVDRAGKRQLEMADMADGTFTISNLGMHGVEHFTALVIPPQGAILAVGAATPHLRLTEDGIVARRRMQYTLTADHRIIDGALAAQFLATVTHLLENPAELTAEDHA